MSKVFQRFHQGFQVIEEITQNDNQTSPFQCGKNLFENRSQTGFLSHTSLIQYMNQLLEILGTGCRFQTVFQVGIECHQPNGITLRKQQVSQSGSQQASVAEFANSALTISHTAGAIEQQITSKVGLIFVFLDVISPRFAIGSPIDMTYFISRVILPMFDKFDA